MYGDRLAPVSRYSANPIPVEFRPALTEAGVYPEPLNLRFSESDPQVRESYLTCLC